MKNIVLKNYILLSSDEHKELLKIRNQENIRQVSLNNEIIELKEHLNFVENLKNNENKKYFAVIVDGEIFGGMNVFGINSQIKWGIFFCQNAPLLLKSMVPIFFIDYVFDKYKPKELFLDVKEDNTNAISFDKNLGFEIVNQSDGTILMSSNRQMYEDAKSGFLLKKIVKKIDKYCFEIEE